MISSIGVVWVIISIEIGYVDAELDTPLPTFNSDNQLINRSTSCPA
jgi:hypothetical protein